MRRAYFLPFGKFAPDGADFDSSLLVKAENLLPIFGGLRSIEQKAILFSQATTGAPTGTFCHLLLLEEQIQLWVPVATRTNTGLWFGVPDVAAGDEWKQIDEATADDSDYIAVSNAPSSKVVTFSLVDLTDPGVATGHIVRFRYRIDNSTSTWSLIPVLMEEPSTVIKTLATETGGSDVGWTNVAYTLTAGEAGGITTYADLYLKFTATVPGATQYFRPASDAQVDGWTTQAGSGSNLYQQIDESSASDADYVQSPALAPAGAVKTYITGYSAVVDPLVEDSANHPYTFRFRYKALDTGTSLKARIKKGTTTVRTITVTPTTSWQQSNTVLTNGEVSTLGDHASVKTEFEASWPTGTAATIFVNALPDSDIYNNRWGSTAPTRWQALSVLDGTDYVSQAIGFAFPGPGVPPDFEVGLGTQPDPVTDSGFSIVVAGATTSGTRTVVFWLKEGSTVRYTTSQVFTTGVTEYVFSIPSSNISPISNFGNLSIYVTVNSEGPPEVVLHYLYLKVPVAHRVQVSWNELQVPSAARCSISYAQLETPDAATSYLGDRNEHYVGTENKIYEVDPLAGFTDVSRVALYGQTNTPRSWSFCSYGGQVIATNFVDAVQIRSPGDATFLNLFTSTDKPMAKYCCIQGGFLVLGNIDPSVGTPGGQSNEIWHSALGDPADMDVSAVTQANRYLTTHTPGEITGLVGGEYTLIFKRNSILRMYYVGLPTIMDIEVLATDTGCAYPRSIVPFGHRVFFRSASGFRWVDGRSGETGEIGRGEVKKIGVDYAFEDRVVELPTGTDEREYDALVIGARCAFSDLIFWSYRKKGDSPYRNSYVSVYSPSEDRFAEISVSGLDVAGLSPHLNVINDDPHLLKGLVGYSWDGTNTAFFRFSGSTTYAAIAKSRVISSKAIDKQTQEVLTFFEARPVYKEQPDPVPAEDRGTITITVRTSDDMLMRNAVESRTQTVPTVEQRYPIDPPIAGEYMDVEVTIGSMVSAALKHIYGLELFYERGGK